jgi:hypothetical protein
MEKERLKKFLVEEDLKSYIRGACRVKILRPELSFTAVLPPAGER